MATAAQHPLTKPENNQLLSVSVTDKFENHIVGLTADSFRVMESKHKKDIIFFSASNQPASIGLLIDTSGSSERKFFLELAKSVTEFLSNGHDSNEYFLATFAESPTLHSKVGSTKAKAIEDLRVLPPVDSKGNTSLRDAIGFAFEKLSVRPFDRKALIVLSDLGDNASKTEPNELIEIAKRSDAIFYCIVIRRPYHNNNVMVESDQFLMAKLAEVSGGQALYIDSSKELGFATTWIAKDIWNRYVIGFEPSISKENSKDKWIEVDVKLDLANTPKIWQKVKARSRAGYYSRPASIK